MNSRSFLLDAAALLGKQSLQAPSAQALSAASGGSGITAFEVDGWSLPKTLNVSGTQLVYRRAGSTPGFPLLVRPNGGTPILLLPGERIALSFSSVLLEAPDWYPLTEIGDDSKLAYVGAPVASLLVLQAGADFFESKDVYATPRSMMLLGARPGAFSADSMRTMNESTTDDLLADETSPQNSYLFSPFGFRRLRYYYRGPSHKITPRYFIGYPGYSTRVQVSMPAHTILVPGSLFGNETLIKAIDIDLPRMASDFGSYYYAGGWRPNPAQGALMMRFDVTEIEGAPTSVDVAIEGIE